MVAVIAAGLGLAVLPTLPASAAGTAQDHLVNTVPATITPSVNDGTVLAMTQVGSRIIAGGTFSQATSPGSSTAVTRTDILAFDTSTGAIDSAFAPTLDGQVQDLTPGPTPDTVYAAGFFNNVNGAKAKSIALLSTVTGKMVTGFKPAAVNGAGYGVRLSGGKVYLGGSFTSVGGATHDGLASLNPTTGALDPSMNVQLTGHHNYTGQGGANGAVGPRKIDISPDGSRMVAIGNFKNANGLLRDQIVMIDLDGGSPAVDPNWATGAYSAACFSGAFDTYVRDVAFSPNGAYFAVGATGGSGTNVDGTNSSCDTIARFETPATGSNIRPTWLDYTGQDTIGSVAVTGSVVYAGGHQRWLNNSSGHDAAGQGAVPRPGLAALDPANGIPYSWNPGRNPRGEGAFALLATAQGVYVGSDTEWVGNHKYKRSRIAYFPLAGGEVVGQPTPAALPSNVYLAGPTADPSKVNELDTRSYDGTTVGSTSAVSTSGINWSQVRGTFMVGNTLFYGMSDGNLYQRSFNGTSLGAPTLVDPYDDPLWSGVQTGSGQTYRGAKPGLYSALPSVTGMFYANGRIYYTRAGSSQLFSRWFEPESGIVGSDETQTTGVDFSKVAGTFISGNSLYYSSSTDGTLHRVNFANGVLDPASNTLVSGPQVDGNDWRARGMFLYGSPPPAHPISLAGTASTNGKATAETVTVPAAVTPGDGMLLISTSGSATPPSGPAGWTQVSSVTNSTMVTTVWRRVAAGEDAGQSVSTTFPTATQSNLQILAYHNTDATNPVADIQSGVDANTSTHTTPTATINNPNAWAVSVWEDRSSTTTSWSPPAGVAVRGANYGSGTARVSGLAADSNGSAGSGSYGGLTAGVDGTSGRGIAFTIVLAPGS
jgi:hypothetical protein